MLIHFFCKDRYMQRFCIHFAIAKEFYISEGTLSILKDAWAFRHNIILFHLSQTSMWFWVNIELSHNYMSQRHILSNSFQTCGKLSQARDFLRAWNCKISFTCFLCKQNYFLVVNRINLGIMKRTFGVLKYLHVFRQFNRFSCARKTIFSEFDFLDEIKIRNGNWYLRLLSWRYMN